MTVQVIQEASGNVALVQHARVLVYLTVPEVQELIVQLQDATAPTTPEQETKE